MKILFNDGIKMKKFLEIIAFFVVSLVYEASAMRWELINESNHRFVVSYFPKETSARNLRRLPTFARGLIYYFPNDITK